MKNPDYKITVTDWEKARSQVCPIRQRVFIEEQHVPPELEWDEMDDQARHAVAQSNDGQTLACGRLTESGQIGRMAVLKPYRNQGVGSAILLALEADAKKHGYSSVFIHAQTQALPFYNRHHYQPQGNEFDEADIPHQKCIKYL